MGSKEENYDDLFQRFGDLDNYSNYLACVEQSNSFKAFTKITKRREFPENNDNDTQIKSRISQWSMEDEFRKDIRNVTLVDIAAKSLLLLLKTTKTFNQIQLVVLCFHGTKFIKDLTEIVDLLKDVVVSIKVIRNQKAEKGASNELVKRFKQHLKESTLVYQSDYLISFDEFKEFLVMEDTCTSLDEFFNYSFGGPGDDDILPNTFDLIWTSVISPTEYEIPDGVKKLTFTNLKSISGSKRVIPNSVIYLKLSIYNGGLSKIPFSKHIKYLDLGCRLNHFVFGHLDIPLSVSHLEITLVQNIAHHWLTFKGTLSRGITHLKLNYPYGKIEQLLNPFLIPTSVHCLDIGTDNIINFQMVDQEEYYRDPLSRDSFKSIANLNSIELSKQWDIPITINTFPIGLQSLSFLNVYRVCFDLGANVLPTTLTSLKCSSIEQIPDHIQLNYLEYPIEYTFLIFKSNDRMITKEKIPIGFDKSTGVFTPQPALPIDELFLQHFNGKIIIPMPNADIRKVKCNQRMRLPDSVQVYVSNYFLPVNYPPLLEQLYLEFDDPGYKKIELLHSIPPTVKYTSFRFYSTSNNNIFKAIEKYKLSSLDEFMKYNSVPINKDSFFQIWRNVFLQKKINEMAQPKLIYTKETNANGISVYRLQDSKLSSYFKFKTDYISDIPYGVHFYSIKERIASAKQYLLLSLPSSVTKLKVDCYGIKKEMIPSNIKHLVLKSLPFGNIEINSLLIPTTVETLEIKACIGPPFTNVQLLPTTLKQVIIKTKTLQYQDHGKGFINQNVMDYLHSKNLLNNQVYQIYDQSSTGIGPLTTILVWQVNKLIPVGFIPNGIKRIVFGNNFNTTILPNTIPNSVTEINFGTGFNQCLSLVYLPASLKYLSLNGYKHPIVQNSLPLNINQLCLSDYDSRLVSSCFFPKSIKYIKINNKRYRQNNLQQIKSNYENENRELNIHIHDHLNNNNNNNYNSNIKSTKTKVFIDNHPIVPGSLDHVNITSISFGSLYNQILLKGALPDTVTELDFGQSIYNQPILCIPTSVQILNLGSITTDLESIVLPSSLTVLYLPNTFDSPIPTGFLPHGLKVLHMNKCFKQIVPVGVIPNTVKEISLSPHQGMASLDFIPSSVGKLQLHGYKGHHSLLSTIPSSVTELIINTLVSIQLIPTSITRLRCLGNDFLGNMDLLPSNIKHLELDGANFTGQIPSTVERIIITNYDTNLYTA
ncbi:hypothetical protein CYY_007502 [Polysphondylium violaceum]|uniref:FNIP repeat-containing protein n=1 Tax=Polysphondylium violaceum TaxID=133409 RepID=A0A8J4PNJ4_9MYCE|nr:hypothetical protein CYY_007502 [Polysphondylium violaceum]